MVGVFASAAERGWAEMLEAKIRNTKIEKTRRFILCFLQLNPRLIDRLHSLLTQPNTSTIIRPPSQLPLVLISVSGYPGFGPVTVYDYLFRNSQAGSQSLRL